MADIVTGLTQVEYRAWHPSLVLTVGKDRADHTTIEAALAAAALVATSSYRVGVLVFPGDYYENNPLDVPQYTTVCAITRHETTRVHCTNPGEHGFVLYGNSDIVGLTIIGVTLSGKAGFVFSANAIECEIHDTKGIDCDTTWLSLASLPSPGIAVRGATVYAGTSTSVAKCLAGGLMNIEGLLVLGTATIDKMLHVSGVGSTMRASSVRVNGTLTNHAMHVEDSGSLQVYSAYLNGPAVGLEVAASGGSAILHSVTFLSTGNDLILADDPSVECVLSGCSADSSTFSIGTNARLSGDFTDTNPNYLGLNVVPELWSGTTPTERVPVTTYIRETADTFWVSGGEVTVNAGFLLDVAPGAGFINTGTGVLRITWLAQQVTVTADNPFYVFIDSSGVAHAQTTEPSLLSDIVLASGQANGASVVLLAKYVVRGDYAVTTYHEYMERVIGSVWISGIAVTELAGPSLQFQVGSGSFYQIDVETAVAASAAPAVFNYWYRNGASWSVTVGATALDDANYDPAGVGLAAIPAGEWVKCAVYVNDNNGVTQWHVVYPQASYAVEGDANAASLPNPPAVFTSTALPCGAFVFQQGSGDITTIYDIRPVVTTAGPGSTAAPATHSLLAGLNADDHGQYALLSGNAARNPVTGELDFGSGGLTLPKSAAPAQVAAGKVVWDTALGELTIGTGASRVNLVNRSSAQTLLNKTLDAAAVSNYLAFTPIADPAWVEGLVFYSSAYGTLCAHTPGGSTLQFGQEQVTPAYNNTGVPIADGAPVYVSGSASGYPAITLADSSTEVTSDGVIGLTTQIVAHGTTGPVTTTGLVHDIDTTGPGAEVWAAGNPLYLGSTPGALTNVKPSSPLHLVHLGWVMVAHPTAGVIYVHPQSGQELDELHDVLIAALADGHILQYEAASSLWKNVRPTTDSHTIESSTLHNVTSSVGTVTITGMSWTPPAGTWDVVFEGEVQAHGNQISTCQFYKDATPIGSIRRRSRNNNEYSSTVNTVRVTTTGAEVISLRASVSSADIDYNGRALHFTRVTAV